MKKYPSGEFTAQAQARARELYEERDWQKARDADTPEAYQAFVKQYPEGKWTEEARIRVENFTLAQAPSGSGSPVAGADPNAVASAGPASATPTAVSAAPAKNSPRVPATAPGGKPTPAAAAASKSAAGAADRSYGIQLGAFKSGAGPALERWATLQKEFPALLSGLTPKVTAKKSDAGTLYRLQAHGVSEQHARALCEALKAKAQACVVVAPGQA